VIVADTSCLILLDKIGHINLLKSVFGKITITQSVANEFNDRLPEFIEIRNPRDKNYQKILESSLGVGEASAMALAMEQDDCLLIIDDFKGRRQAKSLGLNCTGTLGILVVAKERGIIKSVKEVIDEIRKTNFRISKSLLSEVKRKCGEGDL